MDWTLVFTALSAIGAAVAAGVAAWQISVSRRATGAQSFLILHELEVNSRGKNGEDGIAAITALKKYDNYAAFENDVQEDERDAIFKAVAFLNFVATLCEEDYLKVQDAWDLYFMAYRISYDKLWPWWLEYQRESHPKIFPSFERACLVAHAITPEMSKAYESKMLPQHTKRYKRVSKLTKEQLDGALRLWDQPPPKLELENYRAMETERVIG